MSALRLLAPTLLLAIVHPRGAWRAWVRDGCTTRGTVGLLVQWLVLLVACVAVTAALADLDVVTALRWTPVYIAPTLLWVGLRALNFPWLLREREDWFTPALLPHGRVQIRPVTATPALHARVRIALASTLVPPLAMLLIALLHTAQPLTLTYEVLLPVLPIMIGAAWMGALLSHGHVAARSQGVSLATKQRFWWSVVIEVVALAALIFGTFVFAFERVLTIREVPTHSMYPTIEGGTNWESTDANAQPGFDVFGSTPHGDRILIDRTAYSFGEPARWDIIVFDHPKYEAAWLVKRVVGLPGDTIELADGRVRINGNTVRRPDAVLKSQMISLFDFHAVDATLRRNDGADDGSLDLDAQTQTQPQPQSQSQPDERAVDTAWPEPSRVEPPYIVGLATTEVGGPVELLDVDGEQLLKCGFTSQGPYTEDLTDWRTRVGGGADWPRLGVDHDFRDETATPDGANAGVMDRHDLVCEAELAVGATVSWLRLTIESPDGTYEVELRGPAAGVAQNVSRIVPAAVGDNARDWTKADSGGPSLPANDFVRVRWQNVDETLRVWIDGWELTALRLDRALTGDCGREHRNTLRVPNWAENRTVPFLGADGPVLIRRITVAAPTVYVAHANLAEGTSLRIPANCYVVLGDTHSAFSDDSRQWELQSARDAAGNLIIDTEREILARDLQAQATLAAPFLPRGAIRGRVVGIVSPATRIRPLR